MLIRQDRSEKLIRNAEAPEQAIETLSPPTRGARADN